jgi:hypothetical protein
MFTKDQLLTIARYHRKRQREARLRQDMPAMDYHRGRAEQAEELADLCEAEDYDSWSAGTIVCLTPEAEESTLVPDGCRIADGPPG